MKTTLVIDDTIMARLRAEATRRNATLSELVEAGLRLLLESEPAPGKLPPLPTFNGGAVRVDVANRDALYEVMGGRR